MNTWTDQDAEARFSEFFDACLTEGPQRVTRHGAEVAVLVPVNTWRRLVADERPSLKAFLLQEGARTDDLTPRRGAARRGRIS